MRIDKGHKATRKAGTPAAQTKKTDAAKGSPSGIHAAVNSTVERVARDALKLVSPTDRHGAPDSAAADAASRATDGLVQNVDVQRRGEGSRIGLPGFGSTLRDVPGHGTSAEVRDTRPRDAGEVYGRPADGATSTDPRRGSADPTGLLGSSFGVRGSGSPIGADHASLPGGRGGGTNVHTEPGMGGRGPGRTEQASDETATAPAKTEEKSGGGGFFNWLSSVFGSGAGGAGAKTPAGNGAGVVGGTAYGVLTANTGSPEDKANEFRGWAAFVRMFRGESYRPELQEALDSDPTVKKKRSQTPDSTPTPDRVDGETPAWLEEMQATAYGRPTTTTGLNEDHAGPTAPMPSEEEVAASGESRIRARQGERIQYGADGMGPTPTDPDAPPPELPNLGQGPENPTAPEQ